MTGNDKLNEGKTMLAEVARGYARDHGLQPDVEWVDQGFEWMLRLDDDRHTVRVMFSADEIAFFAEVEGADRQTKMKIRNAFASLSM